MRSFLLVSRRSNLECSILSYGGVATSQYARPSSWRLLMSNMLKSPPIKIALSVWSVIMFVVEVTSHLVRGLYFFVSCRKH